MTAAASFTDFKRRLIPNRLINIGLRLALVLQLGQWCLGLALFAGEPALNGPTTSRLLAVIINAIVGMCIAFTLYSCRLWSAGDGKLVIVLALAQPAWIELQGPIPWAPILVIIGNALIVGLIFLGGEAILLGSPRAWRQLVLQVKNRQWPLNRGDLIKIVRITVALLAVVTGLSPLRQWLGAEANELFSGGTFIALCLLMLLYHPLRKLSLTTIGFIALVLLLLTGVTLTLWFHGVDEGTQALLHGLVVACTVIVFRGLISASSRTFDARAISVEELTEGMVLASRQITHMENNARWQEAFMPHMDDLRQKKLIKEDVDNVVRWHANNVPNEEIWIQTPLPFAPALFFAVLLTAITERLLVPRI